MMDDTSASEHEMAVAYLDAIRLAMMGSDSDETRIVIITELLEHAPATEYPKTDTLSVRLFIDAIQARELRVGVPA